MVPPLVNNEISRQQIELADVMSGYKKAEILHLCLLCRAAALRDVFGLKCPAGMDGRGDHAH